MTKKTKNKKQNVTIILFTVGFSPSKKKIIYFSDSPSKMMKNAIYFILKAFFVLKIFKFLSYLFEQRITIHILLNISRIKGNQTMKLGQLIEYPKKSIFL